MYSMKIPGRVVGGIHVFVLLAERLQAVEDRFYGFGGLAQFVAQEQFEVDQHLVVA